MSEPRTAVLGVDGGSTKTRAQVRCIETDTLLGEATAIGSTNLWMHGADEGPGVVAALIDELVSQALPPDVTLTAACVGTAGIDAPNDRARHRAAFAASERLRHLSGKLLVVSDVEVIAACGERDLRVCVIAGTGSNTLGVRLEQNRVQALHQVGGLDVDLSDDGSAAWIGHHAFRAALQDLQGVAPSALGFALCDWLGLPRSREASVWRQLRTLRADMPKARMAQATSEVVVPLAEDDPVARGLLQRAASVLAVGILAAARNVGGGDVLEVLRVGGVWRNPYVRDGVEARLDPYFHDVTYVDADAAHGAAHFARALAHDALDPHWLSGP